jgi:hypothetical protein
MNDNSWRLPRRHREGLVSAVSVGFFFILAGTILLSTPNVIDRITEFFRGFTTIQVPGMGSVHLPAPSDLSLHTAIYSAIAEFCLVWGVFLIVMLVLRFAVHSPLSKKSDNAGDIAFWLGAYYLVSTMLNETMRARAYETWFGFWTGIIVLGGISLIIRAIVLATARLGT